MLTIIESGSQAWALAAADGDLHVYSREEAGEWTELLLSEDSEQIDQDGSSILEALYEAATGQNGQTAEPEAEGEQPEEEAEEPEDEDEEPEDADEEPADEDEERDEDEEEEEQKPRRSRARSRAKKK